MFIAIDRAKPARKAMSKAANRVQANDAKFPGVDRIAIIFGSSALAWTLIGSVVAHYI